MVPEVMFWVLLNWVCLQSMRLLGGAAESFKINLVVGTKPSEPQIAKYLEKVHFISLTCVLQSFPKKRKR